MFLKYRHVSVFVVQTFLLFILCGIANASNSTGVLPSIELKKYPQITYTTNTEFTGTVTSTTSSGFAEDLYRIWDNKGNTDETMKLAMQELNRVKLDNGFKDLYPYSFVLLNEYKDSHNPVLLKYATMLSPSLPDPYFESSYYTLKSKMTINEGLIAELFKAINLFFSDPYNILRFISNRLINIILSVLLIFFIFSLILIIRYSPQIFASLRASLPDYIPTYAIILFSLVIVLSPLLFGMRILWLITIWLFITVFYQTTAERIISVGFIVFMGILIFILIVIFATILKPVEQPFTGIMDINYGNISTQDIDGLEAYASKNPSDLYSNLYMGVYYKRIGKFTEASFYFKNLKDNGYSDQPEVMCDMGNLEYAMGNIAGAENSYKEALAYAQDFFPARYNLGQLYIIQGNIAGTNELDMAKNINPEMFSYYASIYEKSNINRIFVDALPTPAELAYTMFINTLHSHTALGLADVVISRFIKWPSAHNLPYFGLWVLFVFMIAAALSRFVKRHLRCRACGRIYNPLNRNDEYRDKLCTDCFKFYIKNEVKDNSKKAEITRRSYRWKDRLRLVNIISSVLIPGSGYIFRGQTIRGMLLLSIFCYLVLEYITSFGFISPIFPVFNPYISVLKLAVLVLLIMVYTINILLAFRVEAKWY
ncbi:MAG: tetratricopeptide repeat protein [bacterium]